ncbi:sensor histidine kinase [Fibrella aquatilis]|uniref:histidine kinase n=1 Tax=Fibrella aquatilis TaxID=2817059 RepID=A0A939GBW7_9BACT|nr:PAS domain-containing sensor histidine kinase [Fibrella aquatilis]MBO0934715.1 PAS domain-containing protein [Fibrella aquatilis]
MNQSTGHQLPFDNQTGALLHKSGKRRSVREQLLLREAQLSQAQRMAGMASWEWYFGDTAIRWSPEMYVFWGYEPDEIEVDLDSVAQQTHLDDLPILQSAIGRALAGENVEMKYRRYDKFGREIFIHTIGRIIRNEQGQPVGVFGIDMNITKQQEQEAALLALNAELAAKNRELERRNNELASFTYMASHDLQEPLRKIKTFNGMILTTEAAGFTEQGKDYFRRTIATADRMQLLIRDLIAYAQLNDATDLHEPTDLAQLLAEVQTEFRDEITEKGAVIEVGQLPTVTVVRFMFRQLLENLLSNALKYSDPAKMLRIHLTHEILHATEGGTNQLVMRDNGIGFDPIYNERVLGVFQRLHGRTAYSGTGIGLAICQRIMQNHGGTIHADGTPGQGATFVMRWPA